MAGKPFSGHFRKKERAIKSGQREKIGRSLLFPFGKQHINNFWMEKKGNQLDAAAARESEKDTGWCGMKNYEGKGHSLWEKEKEVGIFPRYVEGETGPLLLQHGRRGRKKFFPQGKFSHKNNNKKKCEEAKKSIWQPDPPPSVFLTVFAAAAAVPEDLFHQIFRVRHIR